MEEIRSVTRSTADGAVDTTRAADAMVESARRLGVAIARFKVYRVESDELARNLETRRQEIRHNLRTALDLVEAALTAGPAARTAARYLLHDLQELAPAAPARGATAPSTELMPAGEGPAVAGAGNEPGQA